MRLITGLFLAAFAAQAGVAQESDLRLVSAIELADQGDFPAAFEQLAPGDELGHSLVSWVRLREGAAEFPDYLGFLKDHPDWPDLSRLRAEAERVMPKGLDPATVRVFFASEPPQTGQGAVRLAEAMIAQGRLNDARAEIVRAWTELRLSDEDERTLLLDTFGDVAAPHHLARADALLWRWRTEEAEAMLPLLSEDEAKLIAARLAYIQNEGVAEAAAAVPARFADNADWPMTAIAGWRAAVVGPMLSHCYVSGPSLLNTCKSRFVGRDGDGHWRDGKCARDGHKALMHWPPSIF